MADETIETQVIESKETQPEVTPAQPVEPEATPGNERKFTDDEAAGFLKDIGKLKAKLKTFTDAEEQAKIEAKKAEGKFEEVEQGYKSEIDNLKAELKKHEDAAKKRLELKQTKLAELTNEFTDEQKAHVALGKDIDAQIILAKSLMKSKDGHPGGSRFRAKDKQIKTNGPVEYDDWNVKGG